MSAAVLDSSHSQLVVAKGIAHAMLARQCKACPTMLCIRMVNAYSRERVHPNPSATHFAFVNGHFHKVNSVTQQWSSLLRLVVLHLLVSKAEGFHRVFQTGAGFTAIPSPFGRHFSSANAGGSP